LGSFTRRRRADNGPDLLHGRGEGGRVGTGRPASHLNPLADGAGGRGGGRPLHLVQTHLDSLLQARARQNDLVQVFFLLADDLFHLLAKGFGREGLAAVLLGGAAGVEAGVAPHLRFYHLQDSHALLTPSSRPNETFKNKIHTD
jgi:hypothetical protein